MNAQGSKIIGLYLLLFFGLSCFALPSQAQIYKYRDTDGQWHFSDKPFKQQRRAQTNTAKPVVAKTPRRMGVDLAEALNKRYNPQTPIETATLSVVSIKTPLSVGSGFFISDIGYILTNRHVVRPTENPVWKQQQDALRAENKQITDQQTWLSGERTRLSNMEAELQRYQQAIGDNAGRAGQTLANSDYQIMLKRYQRWKGDYDKAAEASQLQQRKYRLARAEFRQKSAMARLAQRFTIIIKDGASLQAELVALSDKLDLALLRVPGLRTPYLNPSELKPSQGTSVYAIGSPMGQRDYVTAGIVTSLQPDAIITDTQILPGNSGGPLLDQSGQVYGINTQKLSTQVTGREGFGIAIPLPQALKAFEHILRP